MNRREFLFSGAAGAAALALNGCAGLCGANRARFNLAMAGYTLNSFKTDEALKFCNQHGFRYLCVKDYHLPLDAKPAQIAEFRRKCSDLGIVPYGAGPITFCSAEDARKRFDYVAALGAKVLVGVPGVKFGPRWVDTHSDRKMCEICSVLADEYDIRFAIHNHGRNPQTGNPNLYPAVPETYAIIRDLSPRMGLCVDWAYTFADGLNCREIAYSYRDRIFDGHVRCISDRANGSSGTNPSNRVFDYDDLFAALREIGYDGCLGLELANAFPKNPQWIDESRAYFEGLVR